MRFGLRDLIVKMSPENPCTPSDQQCGQSGPCGPNNVSCGESEKPSTPEEPEKHTALDFATGLEALRLQLHAALSR